MSQPDVDHIKMGEEIAASSLRLDAQNERRRIEAIRDKFAGEALQGMLTRSITIFNSVVDNMAPITVIPSPEDVAKEAYEYADAMMKARDTNG